MIVPKNILKNSWNILPVMAMRERVIFEKVKRSFMFTFSPSQFGSKVWRGLFQVKVT